MKPEVVIDDIIDVLEEHDCTIAEAIALIEMLKYNLLRSGEQQEGFTLQ